MSNHVFTVSISSGLSDRHVEKIDWAVSILRDLPGVVVTGWCDPEPLDASEVRARLEQLRAAIRAENISYSEIADLQGLADYIEPGDVELAEWAGIDEQEFMRR